LTLQPGHSVRLTAKQKIRKDRRPDEDRASGIVVWDAEVTNQDDVTVAVYDIMTLVERADDGINWADQKSVPG
jgi:oxepin-CoA hydrolase/3-oxo-5,6-dehydrosuberyl-CoA semialdehyde dehydrogenase